MQDDWPDTPHGQAENRARDLERKLAMLTAPPRRLAPSEVTEPGFYWAKGGSFHRDGPTIVEIESVNPISICEFASECDVRADAFEWFVGPLTPPEVT